MRAPVLALCLLAITLLPLAGCAGRDAGFEKEADGPEAFARDDTACAAAAMLGLSPQAVSYDRNQAFNRLYGDCMGARGHRAGAYARDVPAGPPPPASPSGNS